MITTSENILLVFHLSNYNDAPLTVKCINTYDWNVLKSVNIYSITKPTNFNLLFLNYVTNDYDLIMYCYTISNDEKLRCSCGYFKPSSNNFEPCNIFEIIPKCNRDHNNGFINSILIGNYNEPDGILVICQGSNKKYLHFTKLTFTQSSNSFSHGTIYNLMFDDEVSFPYYAPFTNNDAIFYYYKSHACVTYLYSYTCKNVDLGSIQTSSTQTINFENYFIQGILETNSLSFKINSISSGITLKKGSSVISASTTVGYLITDNFELTAGTVIRNEIIEYYVTGKKNIICSILITIRSGCVEGCGSCDSNGVCVSCGDNYYQKEGESPVICYPSDTPIEGYYFNLSEGKFKKCYDSCKKCNGEGTINDNNCKGECNDGYYIVKNNPNQCWNESIKNEVGIDKYFFKENIYDECDSGCIGCSIDKTNCTSCDTINNYYKVENITSSTLCKLFSDHHYIFSDYKLYQCDENCSTCLDNTNKCTSCNTNKNYYKIENITTSTTCILKTTPHYYISESKLYECAEKCGTCETLSTNCLTCNNENDYYYELSSSLCLKKGTAGYYFSENMMYKCDESCEECEGTSTNCISCNNNYYPIINTISPCYNSAPSKHYLAQVNGNYYYKPCYVSCLTCTGEGNDSENNCIANSCDEGYIPQESKNTNCVLNCEKFYYIDNLTGRFTCYDNDDCPLFYPFLAGKQCVVSCQDDDDCNLCKIKTLYEFNKKCVENCPSGYQVSSDNKKCEIITDESKCNFDKQNIDLDVDKIESKIDDFAENYATKYSNSKNSVTIINNIDSLYSIQIFKNEECLNEDDTISKINLGTCPNILKEKLSLTEIIILKADIYKNENGKKKNIITYAFYSPSGERLNTNLCSEEKMAISIPLTEENGGDVNLAKDMSSKGIDVYDINHPFFNDICFPFTSNEGEDVSLNDRVERYYQNVSLCEVDCEYKGVNYEKSEPEVICECKIKNSFLDNFDNEITGEVFELVSSGYFSLFKCYKNTFNKKEIRKNLGFWIYFVFGIIQIVLIVLYFYFGLIKIRSYLMRRIKMNNPNDESENENKKNEINNIDNNNNNINNNENIIPNPPKNFESKRPEEDFVIYDLNDNLKNNNTPTNIFTHSNLNKSNNLLSNIPKISNLKQISTNKKKLYSNEIQLTGNKNKKIENTISAQDINFNYPNSQSSQREMKIKSPKNDIILFNRKNNEKLQRQNTIIIDEKENSVSYNNSNQKILNKLYTKRILTNKNDDDMFDDDELNEMSVEDAREFDKRTYCSFFWAQLVEKQDIINLFFDDNPLQNFHIRCLIFIFEIQLYIFISAIFYMESLIAKNIHKPKSNSIIEIIINEIERLIYSEIVSLVVEMLTKCLTESEKRLNLLNDTEKYQERFIEQVSLILKDMKIMHYTFIIFDIILYFVFLYYVSAFCAVMKNTKKNWIEGCIITFSIIQFLSFFICFLSTSLRFIGLKYNCLGFLYSIGQFLI